MRHKIRSDEPLSLSLCESDEEKSILQNVYSILTTPKGSVPMYRDFGLPMAYKDKPMNVVETIISSEIMEALKRFEPRASYADVVCEIDEKEPDKIVVILEVDV